MMYPYRLYVYRESVRAIARARARGRPRAPAPRVSRVDETAECRLSRLVHSLPSLGTAESYQPVTMILYPQLLQFTVYKQM
jgi:hypothetical protein